MPLILAVYDYRYVQHRKEPDGGPTGGSLRRSWLYTSLNGPPRLILSAALLSCGNFLTASLNAEPRSTYVCQSAWFARSIVPIVQIMEVSLDCYVSVKIAALIKSRRSDISPKPNMVPMIVALLLVVSVRMKSNQ